MWQAFVGVAHKVLAKGRKNNTHVFFRSSDCSISSDVETYDWIPQILW